MASSWRAHATAPLPLAASSDSRTARVGAPASSSRSHGHPRPDCRRPPRGALRGEVPLDPDAVRALAGPAVDPLAELTPREREVLALMAQGMSNKRIAARLAISEKTVKTHAGHVLAKLAVDDRLQAVLIAKEHGL